MDCCVVCSAVKLWQFDSKVIEIYKKMLVSLREKLLWGCARIKIYGGEKMKKTDKKKRQNCWFKINLLGEVLITIGEFFWWCFDNRFHNNKLWLSHKCLKIEIEQKSALNKFRAVLKMCLNLVWPPFDIQKKRNKVHFVTSCSNC